MKKKNYNLAQQEEELGAVIDQSIQDAEGANKKPSEQAPQKKAPVSIETPAEPKKIMKNIWIPAALDNKIKMIRAYHKQKELPATFDAIANDALVEYTERHLEEAMQWMMKN